MDFKEVIKKRYSCKKYSDKQVEPEKLTSILEAGRLAPTAKNLQEQHIYVIQSAKKLAVCTIVRTYKLNIFFQTYFCTGHYLLLTWFLPV